MVLLDFSLVLLDSSIVLFNFSVVLLDFPWFSSISKVLPDFSMVLTPFSHSFTPFFHGLPNFQMVLLKFFPCFSIVFLLDFSIILRFHSSLPKCHLGGRTKGESIPHRHPMATWYITLKKFQLARLPLYLIPLYPQYPPFISHTILPPLYSIM